MLVCWVHSRVTVAPHVAAVRTGGRSHGGRAGLPERPNCGESSFRKCPSLSCHREAVEPGAEDCSYLLGSTTTEKRAEEPETSSVPTNPAGPLTMLLYSKIPVTRDSPKGCSNCPAIFKETEYQTNGSHGWISLLVPKPFQSPEHFFFPKWQHQDLRRNGAQCQTFWFFFFEVPSFTTSLPSRPSFKCVSPFRPGFTPWVIQ